MQAHAKSRRPFPRAIRAAGFPAGSVRGHQPRRWTSTSFWPTSPRSSRRCCRTTCSPSCSTASSGRICASATAWGTAKRWSATCRSRWARASPGPPPRAASRVLVGDVRNDPRYLNTVDAVRTELAVPMTARGKLVGVIDLQSTRVNAYTEYDRALLRLIAARVGIAIDNARLYRRVERQNRTLKTLANISREFSSILDLNELLGKIASTMRGTDQLRRLQHPAGGPRGQGAAPPVQHPLRPAREYRQRSAGQRASPAPPPNRAKWCACTIPPRTRATSPRIPTSARRWPCR